MRWARSLVGKITLIFLSGVIVAYGVGALVGWSMFVSATAEQWRSGAIIDAQIASATLRGTYTYVAAGVDGAAR